MAFKRPLPEWNNPGIEPPQSKKDMGWLGREKPPAQWHNWFQHLTYKALEELQHGAAHVTFGVTAPTTPDVNDIWVDTSDIPHTLKRFDGIQWVEIGRSTINWTDIDDKPTQFPAEPHTHIINEITGLQDELDSKISLSQKGQPGGVATLDSNSKLNSSQIPDKVIYGDNQYGTINLYDNGVGANGVTKSGFYRPNGLGMSVGLMIAIVHPSSGPNYQIQIGGNYNGDDLKFRKCYNGSWTPEYLIFHDGNQPKITVSSTAPSSPKYGDIWIEP